MYICASNSVIVCSFWALIIFLNFFHLYIIIIFCVLEMIRDKHYYIHNNRYSPLASRSEDVSAPSTIAYRFLYMWAIFITVQISIQNT